MILKATTKSLCCSLSRIPQSSLKFSTLPDASEWTAIHKFRYINGLASMNKLKTYQLCAITAAIPATFTMPEIFDPVVVSVISCSGLATLALASFVFKNTVGFVYTNQKKPELVKFAFMDFWGKRKDVSMMISDVVPVSELPRGFLDDYFTSLKFLNGHTELKLFYKSGGISNHEEFLRVFGSN